VNELLEVEGLSKSFGALRAIADLRFDVKKGEILGLIGPNGAGKTTAINLIAGTAKPDAGQIRFDGELVTAMATHQLVRRGLVRTFQATNIYGEQTVWCNAMRGTFPRSYGGFWPAVIGTAAHKRSHRTAIARVSELLGELNLLDCKDVEARSLPYGRQKALGVVIALAADPKLILLDEPAAGLSAEEADHVADVIQEVNARGVTVLVVDHNMRFINRLCHRVVVLHHGMELCVGTPLEIIKNPQVIEAYLGSEHESA
jgi:branched-chain amino acid transport system ATP-binding protein